MTSPEDLSRALALLGLSAMPSSAGELARLVASRHPASKPWTSEQSRAYQTIWDNIPSGSAMSA